MEADDFFHTPLLLLFQVDRGGEEGGWHHPFQVYGVNRQTGRDPTQGQEQEQEQERRRGNEGGG